MSDLTEHTAWTCQTNVEWTHGVEGSKGTMYTVTFERLPEATEYGYTCTCKGFKYRGECRHIKKVVALERRCAWNETLEIGLEPVVDGDGDRWCPRCGGPVVAVKVGA